MQFFFLSEYPDTHAVTSAFKGIMQVVTFILCFYRPDYNTA